jgi:hypothetical protein
MPAVHLRQTGTDLPWVSPFAEREITISSAPDSRRCH